jgi:hypothetical protein
MSWTLTPIRKYLVIFGLCLGVVPLIGLINFIFLMNAGEFEPLDQIINFQSQHDALYYSALRPVTYPYKLSLFHHVKPRIVALGASRVWQIRSQYFTGPFVNMGGAMASFKDGEAILRKMAASHKPEVVIMGIDPWWFGSGGINFRMGTSNATGQEFRLDMLFMPCDWLIRQKLSYQDYFNVLLGKTPSPIPAIGVTAVTRMDGFYKDGSYYDLGLVTGFHNLGDRKFESVLSKIKAGSDAFKYDKSISKDRWKEFISMVMFAQRENIHLITFLTPLPPRIIDLMANMGDNYAYIDELRAMFPELSKLSYDFFDPRSFGSSDCEFIDGIHGGEITYLRILLEISKDPASGLSPYLNLDKIVKCIDRYRGKAMVPPPFYKQPYTERDFIELGCNKH